MLYFSAQHLCVLLVSSCWFKCGAFIAGLRDPATFFTVEGYAGIFCPAAVVSLSPLLVSGIRCQVKISWTEIMKEAVFFFVCFVVAQGRLQTPRPRFPPHCPPPQPWRRWPCTATSANWGRVAAAWKPPCPRNTSHWEKKPPTHTFTYAVEGWQTHGCIHRGAVTQHYSVSRARFTLPYITTAETTKLIVATRTHSLISCVPVLPLQSGGELASCSTNPQRQERASVVS